MFRIAVLDDDKEYSELINNMVKQVCIESGLEFTLLNFYSSEELLSYMDLSNSAIDILILDIVLQQSNGIDIASEINMNYPMTKIIYLTSYTQYSADISDTKFIYFLLKPIDYNKLKNAIVKSKTIIEKENGDLMWYSHYGQLHSININDIKYLESEAHNVHFFLINNKEIVVAGRLNDFEDKLKLHKKFLRIHQSYLVNMDKIVDMTGDCVKLADGDILSISRKRYNLCKSVFFDFVSERMFNN